MIITEKTKKIIMDYCRDNDDDEFIFRGDKVYQLEYMGDVETLLAEAAECEEFWNGGTHILVK